MIISTIHANWLMLLQFVNRFIDNHFTFFVNWRYFGLHEAIALNKVRGDRMAWLDECYRYLKLQLADCLKYTSNKSVLLNQGKYIWVCWFQGEQNMPEVVRLCIDSMRKNAPCDTSVILVTFENLDEYVEMPQYIIKRMKCGAISLTHFSDILRFSLLSKYGGLWLDSTIFVSRPISEELLQMPLYSIQRNSRRNRHENLYYGACTSFLIGGCAGHPLFEFLLKIFFTYQQRLKHLIEVHWINIAYRFAYECIPEVRDSVDAIGVNNTKTEALLKTINETYDEQSWTDLQREQMWHKLNWRKKYIEYKDGKLTYWGRIKQEVYGSI